MKDLLEISCGLDVHKDKIVACILTGPLGKPTNSEIREFTTLIPDMAALRDWIVSQNCHHVAMESTGIYWMPVYEILSSKDIAGLSRKQKKLYVKLFRALDHDFAHLKSFTVYEPKMLDEFGFSEEEYENYAAMYKNVMEELRQPDDNPGAEEDPIWDDYDLVAYSKLKIDYEYIVELLREFQEFMNSSKNEAKKVARLEEIKEIIAVFAGDNPKLSALLSRAVEEIEKDRNILFEQDIYDFINEKRSSAIDEEIRKFALKWYLKFEDVRYEAFHFRNGELANENKLKDSADYAAYRQEHQDALSKPKFRRLMIEEFKDGLMPEIAPLM